MTTHDIFEYNCKCGVDFTVSVPIDKSFTPRCPSCTRVQRRTLLDPKTSNNKVIELKNPVDPRQTKLF
jgi:hypothetical protein